MEYDIKIERHKRNNLIMRVAPGTLEVYIPTWLTDDNPQVVQFIEKGVERFGDHIPPKASTPLEEAQIRSMVKHWAERIGVHPKRVQLRNMYTKWGSCSRRGTITFDKALGRLPEHLIEYLVCHELVHLVEFDHGEGFQSLMTHHMPDWEQRKDELTTLGLN